MNASSQSFSGGSADTEITAKLPVLDVAAYEAQHDPLSSTDTWAAPTLSTAIAPQPAQMEPDAAPQAEQSATVTSRLEAELRSLASNLSELETRLVAKGERLKVIEAELAESRFVGQAAAARATSLAEELAGQRAAAAAATTRIDALQAVIGEHEASLRAAGERETALRESLQRREAEFAGNAAVDATRMANLAASHDAALQAAHRQLAQLQAQSAAQLENLSSLEGRRGIFDSMLRALDLQIEGRDRQQARLTDELARNTTHGLELTRELDQRARRVVQLEAELAALNSRLGVRTDEVGAIARSNDELTQALQELRQEAQQRSGRIAALEAQLQAADQGHANAQHAAAAAYSELQATNTALGAQQAAQEAELEQLREQSAEHVAAVQQIAAEHANRLALIEERDAQVAALTAQVRSHDMRVAELTRINTQMQGDIADARGWLEERDSLIRRLETQTAHSTALVDNLQRSVRSLAPGNSGTHEVLREAGVRLLVHSQDGHEVVHVLGRRTTIGRTPDNDLQIDASFISRHHAVLLISGQQAIIEDLNSTNGVHVNGHRISREILNDGDQVMVGKAHFRFAIRPAAVRGGPESAA